MSETEDGFIACDIQVVKDLFFSDDPGIRITRSVDGDSGLPIDQWIYQVRWLGQVVSVRLGPEQLRELHRQGMSGVATYTPDGSVRVR